MGTQENGFGMSCLNKLSETIVDIMKHCMEREESSFIKLSFYENSAPNGPFQMEALMESFRADTDLNGEETHQILEGWKVTAPARRNETEGNAGGQQKIEVQRLVRCQSCGVTRYVEFPMNDEDNAEGLGMDDDQPEQNGPSTAQPEGDQ